MQHNNITAKLGDLGIVMSPTKGLVQPIAYRAPEVYFRREIGPAIDIWAWGLIYCQLLEAKACFNKYGLYDDILIQGPFWMREKHVQKSLNNDFDLGARDYYRNTNLPPRDRTQAEGQHWDALLAKGVPHQEVEFLKWVLNPVPTERPTAKEILDSGWLTPDTRDGHAPTAFRPPNARRSGEYTLQSRKRSDSSLASRFYETITQVTKVVAPIVVPPLGKQSYDDDFEELMASGKNNSMTSEEQSKSKGQAAVREPPTKKPRQEDTQPTPQPGRTSVNESVLKSTGSAVQHQPAQRTAPKSGAVQNPAPQRNTLDSIPTSTLTSSHPNSSTRGQNAVQPLSHPPRISVNQSLLDSNKHLGLHSSSSPSSSSPAINLTKEEKARRPTTPRSVTQQSARTYLNYGSYM